MSSNYKNNIKGSKGGQQASAQTRTPVEEPNTLRSKDVFRIVDLISEGEIYSIDQIYFDETPILGAGGVPTIPGVYIDHRRGLPVQTYLEGFPAVETEINMGIELKNGTPIIQAINERDINAVLVSIVVPSLSSTNQTNGDIIGTSVEILIERQSNGGSWVPVIEGAAGTITGKTTSSYKRQYRIPLLGSPPWNIRVSRITQDSTLSYLQNKTVWSSYTKIIDHKLTYPDWAVVGLTFDSAIYGNNVPSRAYRIKGVKIKIPVNYNPFTRVYTGTWNGTFQTEWSNNPAWVLYDIITNNRYGLGSYINASEIDKYAFYSIAQYCDELVPDGKNGYEPRFTFNGVLQTEEDAIKVLQLISSCFRGMVYWGADNTSGIITATQDRPQDPIKLFTQANVIDGIFNYSSSSIQSQHSYAYVAWNDLSNMGQSTVEVVESPNIANIRVHRNIDSPAIGCTSRGQAIRWGKWLLDTELYQKEIVNFKVGIGDADTRPGDVIKIADSDYTALRYAGRLKAATSSTVTLDSPIQMKYGETYSIDVVLPDATLINKSLVFNPNSTDTFTVSTNFSTLPLPNTAWAITSNTVTPRQWRVVTVKEDTNLTFNVTAIYHDPNKYARVEQGIYLASPSFTAISTATLPAPTNLTAKEYLSAYGALFRSNCTLSWTPPSDSRVTGYQLEAKAPNQNYALVKQTTGVTHTIEGTQDGTWSFRVRSIDSFGRFSDWTTLDSFTLQSNNTPPDFPYAMEIRILAEVALIVWVPVNQKNVSHYELRYTQNFTNPDWEKSELVYQKLDKNQTTVTVPIRSGSYMMKTVTYPTEQNPGGVYSIYFAYVSNNFNFLNELNFIGSFDEDPTFSGVLANTRISGGNLEIDVDGSGLSLGFGTYLHENIIDLGDWYVSRFTPKVISAGNLLTNNVDNWGDVDEIQNVDGSTTGAWSVAHSYRRWNTHPYNYQYPFGGVIANSFSIQDLTNGFYTKNATTATSLGTAGDGTSTAYTLSETTSTAIHNINISTSTVINKKYLVGGYFKKNSSSSVKSFQVNLLGKWAVNFTIDVDPQNIVAGEYPGNPVFGLDKVLQTGTIPINKSYFMYYVYFVADVTGTANYRPFAFCNNDFASAYNPSYTGNVSNKADIFGLFWAQLDTLPNLYLDSYFQTLSNGDIYGRVFQLKTDLGSLRNDVTPSIEELSIQVDMPDYIQSEAGKTSLSTGDLFVTFPNKFKSTRPVVVITAQNMTSGDYYGISVPTADGFFISFYNSSGTRIVRTFDYYAKGFGKKV